MNNSQRKRVQFVAATNPKRLVQLGSSGQGRSFAAKPQGVTNTYAHLAAGGNAAVLIGGEPEMMVFDGGPADIMPGAKRAIRKALLARGHFKKSYLKY